jgi:hypothetical protein
VEEDARSVDDEGVAKAEDEDTPVTGSAEEVPEMLLLEGVVG